MVRSVLASIALLGVFGLCSAAHAAPSYVVVPNGATSVDGNTSDDIDDVTDLTGRLQYLYGSGQFFSIGGPILIDQIAFRAEPGSGAVYGAADNLDIYLSTSSRYPNLFGGAENLMSVVFDENIGPDNTLVYSGPLLWDSPGCDMNGTTPCAWDLVINFTTPFFYDPLAGRLLVDMWFTDFTGERGDLDAQDFDPYGSISSLFALAGDAEGSGGVETSGWVTRFGYTSAVPEPSSWSLLLLGGMTLGFIRRRRRL